MSEKQHSFFTAETTVWKIRNRLQQWVIILLMDEKLFSPRLCFLMEKIIEGLVMFSTEHLHPTNEVSRPAVKWFWLIKHPWAVWQLLQWEGCCSWRGSCCQTQKRKESGRIIGPWSSGMMVLEKQSRNWKKKKNFGLYHQKSVKEKKLLFTHQEWCPGSRVCQHGEEMLMQSCWAECLAWQEMPKTWHLWHSLTQPAQGGSNEVTPSRCFSIYVCIFVL